MHKRLVRMYVLQIGQKCVVYSLLTHDKEFEQE